jgi:hypothetical protein
MKGGDVPQVSLYLDKETYERVRRRAGAEKLSTSRYVSQVLNEYDSRGWPAGYWDLFGALDDETFVAPEDVPFDQVQHEVL